MWWYQFTVSKRAMSREKVKGIRQRVPMLKSLSRARSADDAGAFRRSLLSSPTSGDDETELKKFQIFCLIFWLLRS